MSVTIKKVSTARELDAFVKFPLKLYKDCPYYVPNLLSDDLSTLNPKTNAAFEFCLADYFLAYRDGELVGRTAAIINYKANEAWKTNQVRFGWIDFIDDPEVSKALLDIVAAWGKSRGMEEIAGPLGFTDFDPEGLLVEGFGHIGTMITIYNYEYYLRHFENMGFVKEVDWKEFLIKLPEALPERFSKMAGIVLEKNKLKIRKLKRSDIAKEKYGQKLFNLINECYINLYGYSVLSPKQIDQYVKQYLQFIDLRMVSFIENEAGELVATGITMPSLSEGLRKANGKLFPFGWFHMLNSLIFNKSETLDLLLVAIKPEYQNKGLNSVLFLDLVPTLIEMGFKYAETNPELETNTKVQALWGSFDHVQHKRRRIYSKKL